MNERSRLFGLPRLAEPWLPQVLTVIAAVIALNVGIHHVLRHIEEIAAHTSTIWDDALIKAARNIRGRSAMTGETVEYIGWRHTRVRAFNRNPVYVPNALFTTIVVETPTRMTHRRIKETIGIRYGDPDKMAAIVADVKAMPQGHPEIDRGCRFNE